MKRRSFFKSLATLVATVALAPELAFNRPLKPELPNEWAAVPFWHQETRLSYCYTDLYKRYLQETLASPIWKEFPQ